MRSVLIALSTSLLALVVASGASAASVDGMNVYSTSTGSGKATVVLVHGWTCDSSSWDAQVPVLSKHYRVITLDLPGHGRSGAPEDRDSYSPSRIRADLLQIVFDAGARSSDRALFASFAI